MHEPRHQPPFTSRKQDLVPIGWPKSPLGCLLASPCYLPTWRYDGVQLDTFNFALTISPGNRTTHEGFILIVCHARLHKTGTGHGKAGGQLFGRIQPSSHPRLPPHAYSCALTQPARIDRDRGRENVGYSLTIPKKTRSTSRLARISRLVWEARALADGTVTFDTLNPCR